MYLAPRFHLPSEGADLHQAGHCGGRFDSCTAVFLRHHALRAVDELDTGHSPLSYTQIAGHRAGRCPEYLPPGSMKGCFFLNNSAFCKNLSGIFVCDLPCRAAVSVTRNHCCGFGKVAALWVLHHLLLSLCFSSTVQHPVGHPSSTCYTADSLLRAPPGCDEKYNFQFCNTPSSEYIVD